MAFLAPNLTTPVGGNVSQNYFFRDPWSSSPAFTVADEAPNGAAPGGGSNYNTALPNGAPITVNIQETPAVSGKCTATQTTTVKAGTGELTQTQSISCQASASVAGINAIFSNIGNAISSFASAVWSGIMAVANEVGNIANSVGNAIAHTWDQIVGGDLTHVDTAPHASSVPLLSTSSQPVPVGGLFNNHVIGSSSASPGILVHPSISYA